MLKKIIVTLTLFSIPVSAQNDTLKTILRDVVISANRTETPYYTIASSVSVITAEEISRKNYYSIVDLLREIPGLSIVQQGGPGKLSNVFMRGANSNHTLVLLDGIEMNDPSSPNNAFDFSSLSIYDIDRIEIVRGPQSTLYGSDAIAGVVNIYSKTGKSSRHYNLQTEGGSNNFFRAGLSTSGQLGLVDYFFAFNRLAGDGISASNSKYGNSEKDGFTINNFTTGIGFNLHESGKIDLLYKFNKHNSDLDQSEKLGDDPNFNYRTEEQILKIGYSLNSFNEKWEKQFSASVIRRYSNAFDGFDHLHPLQYSDSYNRSERIKLGWQNNFRFLENHLISIGIEAEKEKANTSYISESIWGPYSSIFPEKSVTTTGIYFQDQVNLFNTLFASIGLRIDKHQRFGNETTYRFAPAYYIEEIGMKLKFTYGTGFKAPSLYYLYDPMFGNPDLKPEKSRGLDLGFEKYFNNDRIVVGITYFDLLIDNLFGFDSNFRTINIARASSKGFEFNFELRNSGDFSAAANYTFTETRDLFEGSQDFNKQLLRRPKHQLSVNLNYRLNEKFNLNSTFRYSGQRDDKDFSGFLSRRITMPDYFLVNLAASYRITDFLIITGKLENLLDKEYEEVLYYGTPGRTFYLGLNFNL